MRIFTDGATSKNGYDGARGGWAWIICNEEDDYIYAKGSGAADNVTNNYCELMALIEACEYAVKDKLVCDIYSDSAYCINCYNDKWYRKWQSNGWVNSKKIPVANRELWERLIPYFENQDFNFYKVKGHSFNKLNNLVDKMAVEARLNG